MIQSLPDPQSATRWCAQRRGLGQRVGYVPTMGALHSGHLSLVARAVRENDVACVSIFVNPLQFHQQADLQSYPRDIAQDIALLDGVGCAMVYTGTLAQFFPEVADVRAIQSKDAGTAGRGLEGLYRPGHLQGVYTIVERLFRTVGACTAYFGEKDFQQTVVIAELARGFDGVKVAICPTVREPSGLAMSSRNQLLDATEQRIAARLYQCLLAAREAWRKGIRTAAELEAVMRGAIDTGAENGAENGAGDCAIRVEYAAVRDPVNWSEHSPVGELRQGRALVAAYVGSVRLIDTISLDGH